MKLFLLIKLAIFSFISCNTANDLPSTNGQIIPGAERLDLYIDQISNKRVAVVANQTSMIDDVHLIDSLLGLQINITKVFSPEHGYKGKADAGQKIEDQANSRFDIISLYGKKRKPENKDLAEVDIILFDIQDVGVRFYTYLSTLHYIMEAAAQNDIKVIVLDRPNPNSGYIDGPILQPDFKSFVGLHPVPIVYNMTIGEYAQMIKGEEWIDQAKNLKLEVIPIANYENRPAYIIPIKPSPNLPNNIAIGHYPYLCLFEGTTVSVGRGTSHPFQSFGHPAFNSNEMYSFTPISREGASTPKHQNKKCFGQDLRKVKPDQFFNLDYLITAYQEAKQKDIMFFNENNFFNLLAGNDQLKSKILNGSSTDEIRESWKPELRAFKTKRNKYLIYLD